MTKRQKRTITDQVRDEIKRQGLTCYRVAKETNTSESSIGHFVNRGKGLQSETMDRVAAFLGLEIIRTDELVELRKKG